MKCLTAITTTRSSHLAPLRLVKDPTKVRYYIKKKINTPLVLSQGWGMGPGQHGSACRVMCPQALTFSPRDFFPRFFSLSPTHCSPSRWRILKSCVEVCLSEAKCSVSLLVATRWVLSRSETLLKDYRKKYHSQTY